MTPAFPAVLACKVCDALAPAFGVVDFSHACHVQRGDPLAGIPVYYYRCDACGFLFTDLCDDWEPADFARYIYNAEYARKDPDFAEIRPRLMADMVARMLGENKSVSILDYGGGSGYTAACLRSCGFTDVTTFDPFSSEFAARPERDFDLITCFEVMEHVPRPLETLQDIKGLLSDSGVILLSTLYQPESIQTERLGWWYVAPGNGHISLYTPCSLSHLAANVGMFAWDRCSSVHFLTGTSVPDFARNW